MPIEILQWEHLQAEQQWESLLLGNGASIGLHSGFAYPSLLDVARQRTLLGSSEALFDALNTADFEYVLHALRHADIVNTALGSPSAAITQAYADARSALVQSVREVHSAPHDTEHLNDQIGRFAKRFSTVVTFNYDLTLYWALLASNDRLGPWFKDGFIGANGAFDEGWPRLRRPYGVATGATLFFYAHGNLILGRSPSGDESKIVSGSYGPVLLDAIFNAWQRGQFVPIFVSEGTARDKLRAIRRSRYLSIVYDDVLGNIGNAVAVYGLSFGANDVHILDAMKVRPPSELAVSVYTGATPEQQQAFCHSVIALVVTRLPQTNLRFFDHASPGCWINH